MAQAPDPPPVAAVVARYREDPGWLRDLDLPCTVSNKGPAPDPADLPPGTRIVPLPNVGREAHAFLPRILRTSAAPPHNTAFLQGDPLAHLAPPDEPRPAPEALRDAPFAGLAWFRLRCDGLGRPHDMADPKKKDRGKGWGRDIPVAAAHEALFGRPAPRAFIARAATGNARPRRSPPRPPSRFPRTGAAADSGRSRRREEHGPRLRKTPANPIRRGRVAAGDAADVIKNV